MLINRTMLGTSLIEILVALIVLTGGMLGMARLQVTSLKTTVDSSNYGVAARLNYDIGERIRFEPNQIDAYITATASDLTALTSAPCYTGTGCGGVDRVRAQAAEWQRLLAAQLPGGVGLVCRDATPYDGTGPGDAQCTGAAADPLVIKLWWRARLLQPATVGGDESGVQMQRFVSVMGL